MKVTETDLPGVKIIEPRVFGDSRGFFVETYNLERYADIGIELPFVQDNHSRSQRGVLRGLHYQLQHPQGKLVRVVTGAVLDVAVDIRRGSPTFGGHIAVELSAENQRQLWVPPGFAHGFSVLSEVVDFEYKCTDFYHPEDEYGVLWSDPDLDIDWRVDEAKLSEKDLLWPCLSAVSAESLPNSESYRS